MYRVTLLMLIFILSNCGGGGGTSGTTPLPSGVGLTVTALSNGNPIIGATVQLDNAGQTATTNANGDAIFPGVSGTHDIHVFSNNDIWISAYQVNKSRVYLNTKPTVSSSSFINITGSITNMQFTQFFGKAGTLVATFTTQTRSYSGGLGNVSNGTTYNGFISLNDIPPNTAISGQLRIYELEPVSSQESRIVDMIQLGAKTFTTDAIMRNAPTTFNLVFNTTKPTWVIQTVNGVTLPTGVPFQMVSISDSRKIDPSFGGALGLTDNASSAFPVIYYSAIPQPVPNNVAVCAYGTFWVRCESSPLFGAVTISPSTSSMPSITVGQSGSSIIVTPATGLNQTIQKLSIKDSVSGTSKWTLYSPPSTASITLPVLPANITSRLILGASYNISFSSEFFGSLTYNQFLNTKLVNGDNSPMPYESSATASVSYVR